MALGISNYPQGFIHGLTVRGLPITQAHPGKVFWVNNSAVLAVGGIAGASVNPGTYQKPFSTIAQGLAACTASRGDILMVMPGHAETVSSATGMALNVAGVCIVGLGVGALRPTITLDTAATATITVSAAQMSMKNILIKANYADIAAAITLSTAKDFAMDNCEFRDTSAILNFVVIVATGATSNAADGLYINQCKRVGAGATSATCFVKMVGTNDNLTVTDNYVAHAAVTDAGMMPISAGKVVTNMLCTNNVFNFVGATTATTGTVITTNGSTNSGVFARNLIQSLDATSELLVTASSGFMFSQNYSSAVADKSGYLLPAADA